MHKFPGLIVASAIVLAGCNISSDLPTDQRLGFVTISQYGVGDTATIDVQGSFFQPSATIQPSIPNTASVGDTCTTYDYDGPPGDVQPIKVDNLNAGDSIVITTDKATGKLVPVFNVAGSVDYVLQGGRLPFTPGSDVTVTVPGDSGGFPARTQTVKTLVAPSFTPIERDPDEGLDMHWSPAGPTYGALQLEFLYSNNANPVPNRYMLCSLRDDGSYSIPSYIVAGEWNVSPADAQSASAIRWNTTLDQQSNVLFDVIVQLHVPDVPLSAPAPDEDVRVAGLD
jgi:hypothetical protein